ncbi:MAG: 2OG-Fe(II) oxygenase superfamily-domain-containing protein [Lentinula lateritia]|nr:MAG: 2OG-Fe(II) oxygenase superfamily-domain-containing protein [Lentinula lateritia]
MNDSSNQAYKKARRQYLKTTRNRDPNIDKARTPFPRFPPPDFVKVLDLATLDASRAPEVAAGIWTEKSDALETRAFVTKTGTKGYAMPSIPGLILGLLEGIWNAYVRHGIAIVHPRPIEAETEYLKQNPSSKKLIDNMPADTTDFECLSNVSKPLAPPSLTIQPATCKIPVHDTIWKISKDAVQSVDWKQIFSSTNFDWGPNGPDSMDWQEQYEPDAGIVNFYQTKDNLMTYVDRSEICATSPLVSISLGHAAVFLIGGLTRETEPNPILLRSGDMVIMSGPACRRAYHGMSCMSVENLRSLLSNFNDNKVSRAYSTSDRRGGNLNRYELPYYRVQDVELV